MTGIELFRLKTAVLRDISESPRGCLAICASGYESRASWWWAKARKTLGLDGTNTLAVGFADFRHSLARPVNDKIYEAAGCKLHLVDSADYSGFEKLVREAISHARARLRGRPLDIHVDYSCMPRGWYCRVPSLLLAHLAEGDSVCMWYSPGHYPSTDYPSAGVEDFHAFSGVASNNSTRRTHFMGLGFDWTRSSAIRSVVDPALVVCYFASLRGALQKNYDRCMRDNAALLDSAELRMGLPLDDFTTSLSTLTDLVRQYRRWGDVIIIPDGPKPLILAGSLVPLLLEDEVGTVCLHVGHRSEGFEPVDVRPRGRMWGFRFWKRRDADN